LKSDILGGDFKFLLAHWVEMENMHRHTKFYQHWSNSCKDIAFNVLAAVSRLGFSKIDILNSW